MGNPFAANFQWGNFFLILNVWVFKIGLLLAFWARILWLLLTWDGDSGFLLLTTYVTYQCFHILQVIALMYYSDRPLQDLPACVAAPLTPVYRTWLCLARIVSVTEETFLRRSFHDNYVPPKVRAALFTGSAAPNTICKPTGQRPSHAESCGWGIGEATGRSNPAVPLGQRR